MHSSKLKISDLAEVEDQIYSKRQNVRYDIRDFTVEQIVSKYQDGLDEEEDNFKIYNYIYIPEYQRDFTWDLNRQSKLIESIILGLPIPLIFVAENKDSSWEIVDGSQRIRTLYAFVKNELRLQGLQSLTTLNGYSFKGLENTRQGKILNTALRIIVLAEETTDEVKKDMFERINRGSDLLKPMEKRKGIYPGEFNKFIYQYCKTHDDFKELVKIDLWLENRQEREELLLRFFALSENDTYAKGVDIGISNYLNEYLDKKNKEFEKLEPNKKTKLLELYTEKIDKVVEFVKKYFPYGFRHKQNPQTKRSVFEAISVGVWLIFEKNTPIRKDLSTVFIREKISAPEFKQFTHVPNEMHRKRMLFGRVDYIYTMLTNQKL
jgi:uncharacterized protein with ParB-like and HNH nuclease domain